MTQQMIVAVLLGLLFGALLTVFGVSADRQIADEAEAVKAHQSSLEHHQVDVRDLTECF